MDTLESKITAWKDSLLDAGAFSEEQLYELEDHLRLKLNDLLASGQNEERAFAEACKAIGHPVALGQQYSENNRGLIIKQLLLYFLFGFPVFAAIGQVLDLSKDLTRFFLFSLGWRGYELSIGALLPWLAIATFLLYLTVKSPFWLTDLPKKIAQKKNIAILALLVIFLGLIAIGQSFYLYWSLDNSGLSTREYIIFHISFLPTYLSMAAIWALKAVGIFLFFSIALDAVIKKNQPKKLWRKLCLLSMIGGFFVMGNLISFSLRLVGSIGNYTEVMQQVQLHIFILMATLGAIVLFIFRHLHKKGQLFAHS